MPNISSSQPTATLVTSGGLNITFGPVDNDRWDIFDATSGTHIGVLEVDEDGMFIEASIKEAYQRKGIATAVVRYVVEHYRRDLCFWCPDGLTYQDSRHLSVEGAALANSLVRAGLARWIGIDESYPEEQDQ